MISRAYPEVDEADAGWRLLRDARGGGYFIVYGLIMLVNISPGDDSSGGTNETPRLRAIAAGRDMATENGDASGRKRRARDRDLRVRA